MDNETPQNLHRTRYTPLSSFTKARRLNYRSLLALHAGQSKKERGQSIIIIAVAFVGLLAFVGLAVDFGILLIGMGHLKRAVDSAALAAATQYRSGVNDANALDKSATEFLHLNGVELSDIIVYVKTCDTDPTDTALCPTPHRKLVRITASADVTFVFLPLLGINKFNISASSIAEAASMDVVLVIDISESMTYGNNSLLDPNVCNPTNTCEPFKFVKAAAKQFADSVLNKPKTEEEDRLSIVIFSNGWESGQYATQVIDPCGTFYNGGGCPPLGDPSYDEAHSGWMSDQTQANNVIDSLGVYSPQFNCDNPLFADKPGPCRQMDGSGNFEKMACNWWNKGVGSPPQIDYSTCGTTNIGGGLRLAGQMFNNGRRSDALWVVILLTDGSANTTMLKGTDDLGGGLGTPVPLAIAVPNSPLPIGFCPTQDLNTYCHDLSAVATPRAANDPNYDADDYARDQALYVSCDSKNPAPECVKPGTPDIQGQSALMFAIGLGNAVMNSSVTSTDGKPFGDSLLRYIAAVGDDGNPATDPCSTTYPDPPSPIQDYSCGNYYFRQSGGSLSAVFTDIFGRIYTRITQ